MIDKNYEEFLEITGTSRDFVEDINGFLLARNCKREIKAAKSGFTVKSNYKSVSLQAAYQS